MTYMFNSVVVFILLFYFYFWSFPPSNELLDCFHYCVMWNLAVHFLMICFSYWGFLNFGFLKYIFQNSAWLDTFQNWVLGHFSAITDQKKKMKNENCSAITACALIAENCSAITGLWYKGALILRFWWFFFKSLHWYLRVLRKKLPSPWNFLVIPLFWAPAYLDRLLALKRRYY